MWIEYIEGKQTYLQLASKYGVSIKTIQRRLDKIDIKKQFHTPKSTIVLMDTTYFGRNFGVMVFKNTEGYHLYWKFVKYESIKEYVEGINYLKNQGIIIKGIVCDGRKGLFNALKQYPIQMCQFHQIAIVTRYITRNPKTPAAIELKEIIHLLPKTDKESFLEILEQWFNKWEQFLNERGTNEQTGKSWYIHKRLRSAYRSLHANKQYLFTWYDNIELGLPNTNNQLEGTFTNLKNKLRNHNGLCRKRKEKFINGFLKA
ncbi:MAG: hypothetical protein IPO21_03985 [Bacteroidales bacterium]|nr:hypothetical protein [Bacteroidales bacterium]